MILLICISILIYTYLGYGGIMWFLGKKKKSIPSYLEEQPEITVVVAAYNEEQCIQDKIRNTLSLNYPQHKLNLWIVADGSDDNTVRLASDFDGVKVFHQLERRGKVNAVNRVMKLVKTPYTILTDANASLNKDAIQELIKHFSDKKVAAVSGEKKVHLEENEDAVSAGEGLYWKYESFLKRMDARINSLVGAAGELIAVRTDLYEPVPEDTIIEDFYMTMSFCKQGFKVGYEPKAFATEKSSEDIGQELKRKIRICAGGFQSIIRLAGLLNPFKYGFLTFQYISHRVLRWTLAPIALITLLILSIIQHDSSLWHSLLFWSQIGFYAMAFLGYVLQRQKVKIKGAFVPYYFTIMNIAAIIGFSRLLFNENLVIWEKANRKL